jgi:hypothetical protein
MKITTLRMLQRIVVRNHGMEMSMQEIRHHLAATTGYVSKSSESWSLPISACIIVGIMAVSQSLSYAMCSI